MLMEMILMRKEYDLVGLDCYSKTTQRVTVKEYCFISSF